jgi:hypothetical protein
MSRRNAATPLDPSLSTKKKPSNARRVVSKTDPLNPILSEPFYDPYVEYNERKAMEKNKTRLNRRREIKEKLKDNTLTDNQRRLEEEKLEKDTQKYLNKASIYYDEDGSPTDGDGLTVGKRVSNKYKSVKISKLSPTQQRKLKKGEKLIIKAGNDHEIMLSPEQEKKFNKKSMMGCGITIQLDPYQQDLMSGEGFKDFVGKVKRAKIGKKLIGFAKEHKLGKRVANALIERGLKTIAGAGVETKRKRGRPKKGGALMPAGGALRPAGY